MNYVWFQRLQFTSRCLLESQRGGLNHARARADKTSDLSVEAYGETASRDESGKGPSGEISKARRTRKGFRLFRGRVDERNEEFVLKNKHEVDREFDIEGKQEAERTSLETDRLLRKRGVYALRWEVRHANFFRTKRRT